VTEQETSMRLFTAALAAILLSSSALAAPKVETAAVGLEHPWSLAFLRDGAMLVTERPGRLRVIRDGVLSEPVRGLPAIDAGKQGGMLDVALDPDFAANRTIFFTFSEPRPEGGNGTSVARAKLSADEKRLEELKVIFRQLPAIESSAHFAGRIAIAPDGNLFVTLGDRYIMRDSAQDAGTHIGKVVRISKDGAPAPGNPFIGTQGALPELWSLGHRNAQGAAIEPSTGLLWTVEHGAQGGDEINRPEAGKNYGWPVISYGKDYDDSKIGEGTEKQGMEQPLHYWDPSIAPSGMAFYDGEMFREWKGDLLIGALKGQRLVRLDVEDGKIVGEEAMLTDYGERIRDVRVGPDGAVYLLTDNPRGRVLRVAK
jgi:aldose sugar dehydrogenase